MPSRWTAAHRAAYEATMERKREARERGEVFEKPKRTRTRVKAPPLIEAGTAMRADLERAVEAINAVLRADTSETVAALERFAASVPRPLEDAAERVRQTALRIEDRLAVLYDDRQAVQTPDAHLLAAVRAMNARLAALEAAVRLRDERDREVLQLLRRMDSRPARVVEFRPNHMREADGGTPVRRQRAEAGLTKRTRGVRIVGAGGRSIMLDDVTRAVLDIEVVG